MLKNILDRFQTWFRGDSLPAVTEQSTLHEIARSFAHVYEFVERKYGVKVEPEMKGLSLREFSEQFGLPPAQILFMEVQMSSRFNGVKTLAPREAVKLLEQRKDVKFFDVREDWEMKITQLSGSEALTTEKLDEILSSEARNQPVLLYCHFGVRSLDAATFLADRGFTDVAILKGGIEAWSNEIDPTVPKYESGYC